MLREIEALYARGLYVDSHRLAVECHGPLGEWRGSAAACLMGGRLAGNLGGDRLRRTLILRARRRAEVDSQTPGDVRASSLLFLAYTVMSRRGPLALRRYLRRQTVRAGLAGATEETRADILCLEAHIAAAGGAILVVVFLGFGGCSW